jgi:hypothetical protein
MEEIAAALDVADKTVKRRARDLKGLGLIKSGMQGYFLTPKGVRFLKRWLIDVEKKAGEQQELLTDSDDAQKQLPVNEGVPRVPRVPEKKVRGVFFKNKNNVVVHEDNSIIKNNPFDPKTEDIEDSEDTIIISGTTAEDVPSDPSVPKTRIDPEKTGDGDDDNGESQSQLAGYRQLSCYFCGKPIIDADWVSDGFTENKPAHKNCYDRKQGYANFFY